MIAIFDNQNNYISEKAYWFVLFLVVFIPFEDFILKFLPGSDALYFYARFISEALLYAVFVIAIVQKIINGKQLFRTPLDLPLFLFLQITLISAIVNQSGLMETVINIRPVFRYVILFYTVVNIQLNLTQASKILRYSIFAGAAQLAVGLLQFASRGALNELLQPRDTDLDIGGAGKTFVLLSGREIGSIYGAAGDTILFASFMILFLILILSKMYINNDNDQISRTGHERGLINALKRNNNLLFVILIGTIVFITSFAYARACLFATIVIILAYCWRKFYNRNRLGIAIVVFSLMIPLFAFSLNSIAEFRKAEYSDNARQEEQSVIDNTAGILTEEYIETARQQRLGAVVDIPLTVIFNKPLLGFGPDKLKTIDEINNSPTSFLTREWEEEAFNDVYWSAQMAYYGILGVFALGWLFYRMQKWSRIIYRKTQQKLIKELALSSITITFTTIVLLFFNQFIEFRIYSLYFWLFPALIFKLYHQEKFGLLED